MRLHPQHLLESRLTADARPVRVILSDKKCDRNWALGWPKDRPIVVRERISSDGLVP